jgi:hypothetical protein
MPGPHPLIGTEVTAGNENIKKEQVSGREETKSRLGPAAAFREG